MKYDFTPECSAAVAKLKAHLVSDQVLAHPDYTKQFVVQPDASIFAVGGVLVQLDDLGRERPISFRSKKLTPAEQRYAVYELEALGVIYCVRKWRHYIEGTRFLLVTDHNALLWLFRQPHLRGKLARWALDLQQFDFMILHRPGKIHIVPDAVSRLRRLDENNDNDEQGLDTDEVCDKAFTLGEMELVPVRVLHISDLIRKARGSGDAVLLRELDFQPAFVNCCVSSLISVAVAQQRDLADLSNLDIDLKFLKFNEVAADSECGSKKLSPWLIDDSEKLLP